MLRIPTPLVVPFGFALLVGFVGCSSSATNSPAGPPTAPIPPEKIYVAVENDGTVAVLGGDHLELRTKIPFENAMAHNVQVAPDGRTVWVTLPAMEMAGGMKMQDKVAVIDPISDVVLGTIDLGEEVHPAHVVVSSDGSTAWVTGGTTNELIRIDVATRTVLDRMPLGHGATPHGERLSPDGSTVWIAKMDGKCVAAMPVAGGDAAHVMLDGEAVQVAVTRDWVFASQYDTKKVARIDARTLEVRYADLPADAQGPAQVYPTANGATVLVADQGLLEGRPASDRLYFLDVATLSVNGSVEVGRGAHGVVVSGGRAYVTAAADGTVSMIDLATREVLATTPVGDKPNGVSAWSPGVGTP